MGRDLSAQDLGYVREIIHREIERSGGVIREGLLHLVNRKSRHIRPLLVLFSARAAGGDRAINDRILHLAAAVEMLHTATLIHDDILDGAKLRRGETVLHEWYDVRSALLMGDFLFARSYALLATWTGSATISLFSSAIGRIVTAEADAQAGMRSLSLRRYKRWITGKTVVLFVLCCHAGAFESTAVGRDGVQETLRRIGYNLGISFQIRDDILDFTGDVEETGKERGLDLRAGLLTLPVILALAEGEQRGLKELLDGGEGVESDMTEVTNRVIRAGGVERAEKVAEACTVRALNEIRKLPSGTGRDGLRAIAEALRF